MFDLDHLTTACVALAKDGPDGEARVLRQARLNLLARARGSQSTVD
jgi:hypothetical protein